VSIELFLINSDLNKKYNLRNLLELKITDKGNFNDFGEDTFVYFFSKLINESQMTLFQTKN